MATRLHEQTTVQNTLWRCLHVRRRFELIVALHLEKQSLETFVPFCGMHDRSPKGQSPIGVPLFPGYVFFKCDFVAWRTIHAIPGVLAIVRNAQSIGIVRTHEIENLRRVVNSGISCELWPHLPGRSVTVEDGPLRGISGTLVNAIGKHRLVLPISLMCLSVAFEIDDSRGLSQAYPPRSEAPLRHDRDQIGSRL